MGYAALRMDSDEWRLRRRSESTSGAMVVGSEDPERRRLIRQAVHRADEPLVACADTEHARQVLADPAVPPPRCIFLDTALSGLESFVSWLRGEARLFSVPVIVQVAAPNDPAYCEAYALGADDAMVLDDAGGITRRLANLADYDPAERPPITHGRAVVAHASTRRRRVLGRILRQAGFEVAFAVDGSEVIRVVRGGQPPSLVVADHELPSGGASSVLHEVRAAGATRGAAVIVLGPRDALEQHAEDYERYGRVALSETDAPADNLLFLANELMRPDVQNVRASKRILFGTICAFRPAGALEPVYGLTYNISREGLYVRTLDPPSPGTPLWFEMRPPFGREAVHLRGSVVWHRGLRSGGGAAPPGFGLRIDESACPPADLAAYREAYETLRDETFFARH